ncbi:Ima1 N-terminal domain-containing protein [Aspergillus californicus]
MAPLFSKRISCFYCGGRSVQSDKGPVRKFKCKQCEAVNYLDENGEITDPPAADTNSQSQTPGPSNPGFKSLTGSGLFCAQCVRNQHLFTTALASYFPSSDDPNYSAYEREYPKFRKNLEERYPQVCDKCEPRVNARIRQTKYEAKSDHLRRIMDRSKTGKAARQARRWNWRSLLVLVGAVFYWASVAGQLAWDLASAVTIENPLSNPDNVTQSHYVVVCFQQTLRTRHLPSGCLVDMAPYAGLSLVAGILSLWWNPKLRMKVEGRGGRFLGLGEYYKVQLIVMVVRSAFWAVLRDPLSSGIDATLSPALHSFMIFFTIMSIVISRRVVSYDTRPLVNWAETPSATPALKAKVSPRPTTGGKQPFYTPHESTQRVTPCFPLEKLATPRSTQQERAIPTPPPEVDDMDWTPSIQHNFRPNSTVHQRDQPSILDGPTPFYGQLPPAPKPPSWNLRNRPSQLQKPLDQVVERNPFYRNPVQSSAGWKRDTSSTDAAFAPPKFFPTSDHASTGLENLFDRTFTIKSPEEEDSWHSPLHQTSNPKPSYSADLHGAFVSQCVRFGLLVITLLAWNLSSHELISLPGDYVEVASLGVASLLAGFALLESVKQPIRQWNGMELLVYFAEFAAAVHLGGYLPGASLERQYFDRYGRLLLVFMSVQEALGLQAVYSGTTSAPSPPQEHQHDRPDSPNGTITNDSPKSRASALQPLGSPSSPTATPSLSFSSTALGSSFANQHPEPQQYQLPLAYNDPYRINNANFNQNHSFSLKSLKHQDANASEHDYDRDSDTETTMTTATTATNNTIKNIRYGPNSTVNDVFFSPRRSELGPGLGGLSLDDGPGISKRMTRSQSQRLRR